MSVPIHNELIEECAYLFEQLGMKVVDHRFYPEVFGDSYADLQSEVARVRITRDRGQIFVRAAPLRNPDDWTSFMFSVSPPTAVFPSVEAACEAVRKYVEFEGKETIFCLPTRLSEDGSRLIPSWGPGKLL